MHPSTYMHMHLQPSCTCTCTCTCIRLCTHTNGNPWHVHVGAHAQGMYDLSYYLWNPFLDRRLDVAHEAISAGLRRLAVQLSSPTLPPSMPGGAKQAAMGGGGSMRMGDLADSMHAGARSAAFEPEIGGRPDCQSRCSRRLARRLEKGLERGPPRRKAEGETPQQQLGARGQSAGQRGRRERREQRAHRCGAERATDDAQLNGAERSSAPRASCSKEATHPRDLLAA